LQCIRHVKKHGGDVRLLEHLPHPVNAIICQPPCTHFAGSGARWWAGKGEAALLDGLSIVDACLRAVAIYRPRWWVLENPVGRLSAYLGKPAATYNPCDYGGWIDGGGDAYTKRTCLWGYGWTMPGKRPVEPTEGSKMHLLYGGKSERTKEARSVTPAGFAAAWHAANPLEAHP
jgi:hypothetical protein